jgi:inhibitor of cysteine peptidase
MRIIVILALISLSSYAFAETHDDMINTINTTVGKEFVITLDANSTTGYEWQLANPTDDGLIKLGSSEYVPDRTGLVGSGGKSIWTFKAIQAGKAQLSFKYIRPWEKDASPVKSAVYIVNIQESVKASEAPDMINPPQIGRASGRERVWPTV